MLTQPCTALTVSRMRFRSIVQLPERQRSGGWTHWSHFYLTGIRSKTEIISAMFIHGFGCQNLYVFLVFPVMFCFMLHGRGKNHWRGRKCPHVASRLSKQLKHFKFQIAFVEKMALFNCVMIRSTAYENYSTSWFFTLKGPHSLQIKSRFPKKTFKQLKRYYRLLATEKIFLSPAAKTFTVPRIGNLIMERTKMIFLSIFVLFSATYTQTSFFEHKRGACAIRSGGSISEHADGREPSIVAARQWTRFTSSSTLNNVNYASDAKNMSWDSFTCIFEERMRIIKLRIGASNVNGVSKMRKLK